MKKETKQKVLGQASKVVNMAAGTKDAVLALDTKIDSINAINAAAQGRIVAIIHPGGAQNDANLIQKADNLNLAMVLTGIEHIRH